MSRLIIALKNIAAPAEVVTLRDLNDSAVGISQTIEISDTNSYDAVMSSKDLYAAVDADKLIIVLDGAELTKGGSLLFLQLSLGLAANEGQVKLNTGNGVKPSYSWGGANPAPGVWQQIMYASPLGLSSAPTTQWPQNEAAPADGDLYDSVNDTFLENPILGQVNFWRISLNYTGKPANIAAGITLRVENTLSGFIADDVRGLPRTSTEGSVVFALFTIADNASLPPPLGTGQGYEFSLTTTDDMTVEIDSIVRSGYQKNPR